MVADPEQVDKINASEFHNVKLNAKGMTSYWRRSGSENIHLDRGQRTRTMKSSRRPSWESDREILLKIASKNIWENLS